MNQKHIQHLIKIQLLVMLLTLGASVQHISGTTNNLTMKEYSAAIEFQFSGTNKSGILACPWYVNESSQQLVGVNEQFRTYFEEDIKNTTATLHPDYFREESFIFSYVSAHNHFKDQPQVYIDDDPRIYPYFYNNSEFDPYYTEVLFNITTSVVTRNEWNNTVVPELLAIFKTKWYVEDVMSKLYPAANATFPAVGLIIMALLGYALLKRHRSRKR